MIGDLAKIESYLKNGDAESAMWLMDGVPIRDLDKTTPIMDRYKDTVLKYLLTLIKTYGLRDNMVDSIINSVRRTRVTWPEMTTILNSQAKDVERINEAHRRLT